MENPKGALRHLWAAIQLLRGSEDGLTNDEVANMVPLFDAMIRLDFLAQKLVPYARSSFMRCSNIAIMESPFWNRPSLKFSGLSPMDPVAAEKNRLIQLICGHNKLSQVVWGCWCPLGERPSREELMGFYAEMNLWKQNAPATLASCKALEGLRALDTPCVELLTMPAPACQFLSSEAALNVAMYNGYMGCAVAMIATTDEDPAARELEAFNLVYQNMCIAAGLIEGYKEYDGTGSSYKPCDAISMGISIALFHGARRCFSLAWMSWTIDMLRTIGREGLSNGFTLANTLEIMCQVENRVLPKGVHTLCETTFHAYLGPLRDRLIPLLLPRGEDGELLAFYLRYGYSEVNRDERNIQVVARATWKQNLKGERDSLKLDIFDLEIAGDNYSPHRPHALEIFEPWRQAVEKGWHGYLANEVDLGLLQKGKLQMETIKGTQYVTR